MSHSQTILWIIIAIWLVPSFTLWMFGQVRYFFNVFFWPLFTLLILMAAIAAFITEGGFVGLRKFWNHINGRGFSL